MGWASVGACIIAGGFLLYHHPPHTWNLSLSFKPPRPFNVPFGEEAPKYGKLNESNNSLSTSVDKHSDALSPSSPRTTPKASAIRQTPQQVPEFRLDTTHSSPEEHKQPDRSQEQNVRSNSFSNPCVPTVSAALPKAAAANSASSLIPPLPYSRSPAIPPFIPNQTPAAQRPSPPTTNGGQFLVPPKPKPSTALRPPPSAAATLRASQRTAPSQLLSSSTLAPTARQSSRKVILEPGHSPLDWAMLTSDPRHNLRGQNLPSTLIKVTPAMLKVHNGRKGVDAWTSYQGKVYNITPYIPFHPGGKGEILRGAGKDSGKLFLEVHPWVNWDGMLSECLVGILVSETESLSIQSNSLDAMD